MIVPLKDVKIKARVESGLTKTTAQLTYSNKLSIAPIEVTFEYPLVKNQVVGEFSAVIGDRSVTARVQNKEKAKEKYDQAIQDGEQAIFAERDTDDN